MRQFLVLGFLFAAAYGSVLPSVPQVAMDWDRSGMVVDGRVVGGEDADISDAPWQTAMLMSRLGGSFSQSCGGSIITPTVVACAAHCSSGSTASQWRVRGGSTFSLSGGQLAEVASLINHPQYSSLRIDYDISLYVLSNAFAINGVTIAAIPLPAQDLVVPDGSPSLVTGWGATREGGSTVPNLQKVVIPTVNQEACVSAYSPLNTVTPRMICAGNLVEGGQDACQGDSGGPLAVNGVLIGVTSWGRGCARPGYPGVWARVPVFRNWIDEQISQL